MKKKILTAFAVIMLFFAVSCGGNNHYGILDYQNNDITAQCTVNGKYDIIIINEEDFCSLSISAPAELSGTRFEYNGNECYAISGDIRIPVEKEKLKGIFALIGIFNLDEAAVTTAESIEGAGIINFDNNYGRYSLTYNEMGMPIKAEISNGEYSFDVIINTITLEKRETK